MKGGCVSTELRRNTCTTELDFAGHYWLQNMHLAAHPQILLCFFSSFLYRGSQETNIRLKYQHLPPNPICMACLHPHNQKINKFPTIRNWKQIIQIIVWIWLELFRTNRKTCLHFFSYSVNIFHSLEFL